MKVLKITNVNFATKIFMLLNILRPTLALFMKRQRIINVDESWLNQTRFIRRIWVPSDAAGTIRDKQVQPRISLIAALDTDGRIWFALT